jgi:hypothetical protein
MTKVLTSYASEQGTNIMYVLFRRTDKRHCIIGVALALH